MSSFSLQIAEALVERLHAELLELMSLRYRVPPGHRMPLRLYIDCFCSKWRVLHAAREWRDSILYDISFLSGKTQPEQFQPTPGDVPGNVDNSTGPEGQK